MNTNITHETTIQSLITGLNHVLKVDGEPQINYFTKNEYGAFNKMSLVQSKFTSNNWVSEFDLKNNNLSLKDKAYPHYVSTVVKAQTNGKNHKKVRTYQVYNLEQVNI
jgi:hypothetical protein